MAWKIDELIDDSDLVYERDLARDANQESIWLDYYNHKLAKHVNSPETKQTYRELVFVLERAVRQLPHSHQLWSRYYEVIGEPDETASQKQIQLFSRIYERATANSSELDAWLVYLQFLTEFCNYEVTLIRRTFDKALLAVNSKYHYHIWKQYVKFADSVGGPTAAAIYKRYSQYIDPEILAKKSLETNFVGDDENRSGDEHREFHIGKPTSIEVQSLYDFIDKFKELGAQSEVRNIYEQLLASPEKYKSLGTPLKFLQEYIDFLSKREEEENFDIQEKSSLIESLILQAIQLDPENLGEIYKGFSRYLQTPNSSIDARYYFEKGLKNCLTVRDFEIIYRLYTNYQEEKLVQLRDDIKKYPTEDSYSIEFNFRIHCLETLIDNRPILLNDMSLRQDRNNLDAWFKRVDIYGENLNQILKVYVSAISSINPFQAHSASGIEANKLSKIWIDYASVYASREDYSTANLIYSKAVESQFRDLDELAELYIQWSEMLLQSNFDDADSRSLSVIEDVLLKKFDPDLDKHAKQSVQFRIHRSTKLWMFYLDLLESFIEDKDSTSEIEKVIKAYDKMIEMKIATARTIINYAQFLQSWKYFEKSFKVYESGLTYFKDSEVRYHIWKLYLPEILQRENIGIERIRDLFEMCLFGNENDVGIPAHLSKDLILQYFQFEKGKGFLMNSIRILKSGIQKLRKELSEQNVSRNVRNNLAIDKFDLYKKVFETIGILQDTDETRNAYESAVQDDSLTLPQIIEVTNSFINFEKSLKQLDRVRALFKFVTRLSAPDAIIMKQVWEAWEQFEVEYGSEATFKDMLRFKRTVVEEYARNELLKNSLNPMGFVKSSTGPKVSSINASEEREPQKVNEEANPDQIEMDMDDL
ncbi:hypothetical protein G9P44_005185 [Scheffersomyces stipitis]|nr:hypothetical protein G9P44_005185 [Scheffersomyces stipitis]